MRQDYEDYYPDPTGNWSGGDWDPIRQFDPYSGDPFAPNFVGPLSQEQLAELRARQQSRHNNALGIRDVSSQELTGSGVPGECGCPGKAAPMTGPLETRHHAATYIPMPFRMKHKRLGSGAHVAMLGARVVLQFDTKKACAAFCRAWNSLMSHIGQADEFLPGDLTQVFSDLLIGGSGKYGAENEFTPPFRGRIMV